MKRILGLDVAALFARVTALSLRNASAVVAVTAALGVAGLLLALGLSPSVSQGTLAGTGSGPSKATAELHRDFGDEPVTVLVKGRLSAMLLTQDVAQLLGLEGCISGRLPARAKAPAPVCREFAERRPVKVVYGPATFINDAAGRILDRLGLDQATVQAQAERAARRARRAARQQGLGPQAQRGAADQARTLATSQLAQEVAIRYGLQSVPALNNPRFVLQLVFAPAIGAEQPKPRFAYVFPDANAALIQTRLRSDLSASERKHAVGMIREAVQSPAFKLKFGSYVVTGDPVVRQGIASGLPGQLAAVLVAAALLLAVALALGFRRRLPLLPLPLALVATAVAYGLARVLGASLTLGMVAAAPISIALAAVFAMLLLARFDRARPGVADATAVLTVALAIAAGLIALLVAPVPAVRSLGIVAIVVMALAFVAGLTAGVAVLGADAFRGLVPRLPRPNDRSPRLSRLREWGSAVFAASLARPRRTLWIAGAVAVLGWGLGTQVEVVNDLTRLAPSDRQEVKDADTLRDFARSAGQVSVLVRGRDLSDPRAIAWMADYQGRVLTRHGYSERRPCRTAQLCPGLSITNLFTGGLPRSPLQARAALRSLPAYFAGNVITPDRRAASMGFVLRADSPGAQRKVIDDMRSQLDPPKGITARLAGEPVIAASTRGDLETSRWTLALAAILAMLVVLLAVYRRIERAFVPLVPAILATGWAALAVFVLQVPTNPISVSLGAILVASVGALGTLLCARYREQRASGLTPEESLTRAWRSSAGEVALVGALLMAGFLALTLSDYKVLRDFGVVAFFGLGLGLLGLMVVLPATVLIAEEGVSLRLPTTRAEAGALARGFGRGVRSGLAGAGRLGRAAVAGVRRAAPSRK